MSEVGVNFLRKMSRKKLDAYISNLESVLSKESNAKNIQLFQSWLNDAYKEVEFRTIRKVDFLKRNNIL